ncbi:MAG: hypothetical protein Q8Q30_02810 [Candidatus Woesebacteria bacterium]|nr:hypothetical protein [Candidatus Woesebacteria bacterium]
MQKKIYLIILLLSIPAVRYLFVYGYFGVSDDLHIGWLFEMDRVVKSLQFPPRFVPDLSFGFGYPLFNFVYPLPFYIAEIFHLIGFSLVNSVKIVFGLSIPLSMFFMYKLLKHFASEELSLAGAVLYVYAPYRALEIYVRGTLGEIVAFVFLPLIILAVIKKKPYVLALSFAGLILSHNIMAYMFMPFLLLFTILNRSFLVSLKGLLLGLLYSAYFWVPAIYESSLMKYDTVFNFYDHYPALKQFITPYWGYGASVPGNYDTMSFYMGIVGLSVMLFGSILFITSITKFSKEEKIILGWSVFTILVSVFMMNFRSAFIWRNIPLLPYFQFPWRFLAMITLLSPIFLLGFSKLKSKRLVKLISLTVLISAIFFNFNYFKTSEYLGRGDDYYLNRYIPSLSVSDAYKQTSEEYLRLPKGTKVRPDKLYPRAYTKDPDVRFKIEEINALDSKITTESKNEFMFNYNKYNYPGFVAKIDGNKTKIIAGEPFGQISFTVPSGKHTVVVEYKESPMRLLFDIVSLIAIGVSVIIICKKQYQHS